MSTVVAIVYAERIALAVLILGMLGGLGVALLIVHAIGGWR